MYVLCSARYKDTEGGSVDVSSTNASLDTTATTALATATNINTTAAGTTLPFTITASSTPTTASNAFDGVILFRRRKRRRDKGILRYVIHAIMI
ncbi:hypothetical protein ARMSODRAFT_960213 [Armillaria solidipes]|uniref:Uncharacterized protein n=1 Tax=Armillaria solidipes TaxID=1076256 RepID=A0A2H3B5X6_9AGAR|nr:hypothetical protein ARMSODRAFT_960213 [Armillaria solidipes]